MYLTNDETAILRVIGKCQIENFQTKCFAVAPEDEENTEEESDRPEGWVRCLWEYGVVWWKSSPTHTPVEK